MVHRPIRALLIDLSGTLHVGNEATPYAAESIVKLREAKIILRWVSNTSKEGKRSLLDRLHAMNLDVREEELFTSLSAVSQLVKSKGLNPFYILSDSSRQDFPESNLSKEYDAVVVGLAPTRLDYRHLNKAFRILNKDAQRPLIVAHKANYYQSSDGELSLGPGIFVTGLEDACKRVAITVGKPSEEFFRQALKSLEKDGITESEWSSVAMVGDDKTQDVGQIVVNLKLSRFLVMTGKYRYGDENEVPPSEYSPFHLQESFSQVVSHVVLASKS